MEKTLAEIAKIIEGEVVGDKNLVITGLSGIEEANEGDLTFVANSKYIPLIKKTKASAIITPRDMEVPGKPTIRANNPSLAFANIASLMAEEDPLCFQGVHKTAIIADEVKLGKNVTVGPYAIVEPNVKIGDNSIIYGGTYIGQKTIIGKDCLIYPHVTVRERTEIRDRVIIHSGTVVGSDGFGFEEDGGAHVKIPQLGTVLIEDDVEIGANVTIDRARFAKTVVGKGSKIDNLVQIAHNVVIGENCIIVAQVGISGSTMIGKNSILAGQAGLAGHLKVGEGSIVAAQAGVSKSIPPFSKVSGYPAKPHAHAKRVNACLQRLPDYVKKIQELGKRIEGLEDQLKEKK